LIDWSTDRLFPIQPTQQTIQHHHHQQQQTLVANGVETVAELAALEPRDLGQYGLSRDVASKLGRAVSSTGAVSGCAVDAFVWYVYVCPYNKPLHIVSLASCCSLLSALQGWRTGCFRGGEGTPTRISRLPFFKSLMAARFVLLVDIYF
jgi:hypothetical protein